MNEIWILEEQESMVVVVAFKLSEKNFMFLSLSTKCSVEYNGLYYVQYYYFNEHYDSFVSSLCNLQFYLVPFVRTSQVENNWQ